MTSPLSPIEIYNSAHPTKSIAVTMKISTCQLLDLFMNYDGTTYYAKRLQDTLKNNYCIDMSIHEAQNIVKDAHETVHMEYIDDTVSTYSRSDLDSMIQDCVVINIQKNSRLSLEYQKHNEQFAQIMDDVGGRKFIQRYIFMKCNDHQKSEDITQLVLIKIFEALKRGRYDNEQKAVHWVSRIISNCFIDHQRKIKRKAKVMSPLPFAGYQTFGPDQWMHTKDSDGLALLIKEIDHEIVRELIEQLPPEQKEVVILRQYADMSFKEIAILTKTNINTAIGRMRYALINLRKFMQITDLPH